MVHLLGDPRYPAEAHHGQVGALIHHADHVGEAFELTALRRSQWVCLEERKDPVAEFPVRPDLEAVQVFSVIVVSPVEDNTSAAEEPLQLLQNLQAPRSLNHREGRLHLPADPARMVPEDRNAEATLAVDEADDPLLETWPFLLIARTRRILTCHVPTIRRGSDMAGTARYSGFPANSQLHSCRHRHEGQFGDSARPRSLP